MDLATPGARLLKRYHLFVPAVAACAVAGALGGAAGGVIVLFSQALFGWGAYRALNPDEAATGALTRRLPAQLLLFAGYGLAGLLLLGLPIALGHRYPGWPLLLLAGVSGALFLVGTLRLWPAFGVLFAVPEHQLESALVGRPMLALRGASKLTRGNLERTLEGLPLVLALILLMASPFVMNWIPLAAETRLYPLVVVGLALLVAPWVHGLLILSVADALAMEAATDGEVPVEKESETMEEDGMLDSTGSLVAAAGAGSLYLLRDLLERGADPNGVEAGRTPLIAAVSAPAASRHSVMEWLLAHGAEPSRCDARGWTALHHAAAADDVEAVRLLVERGADAEVLDRGRLSPLGAACEAAAWAAAKALLELGASPHPGDGLAPLHLAAAADGDDPAGVELLLRAGEAVDARANLGRTALMGAAMRGNALVAAALLEAGADVNARDDFGNTPLMEAARAGANGVLQRFVLWQPETEHRDKPGRTALLVAVCSRRADVETVRLLLAMGADPKVENREGRSAGELAAADGRWRMARMLGVKVHEPLPRRVPAAGTEEAGDEAQVIDLALFETEEDRAWAERRLSGRSRTELDAATQVIPALDLSEEEAAAAAGVPALPAEPTDEDLPGEDLDVVVEIDFDPVAAREAGEALAGDGRDAEAEAAEGVPCEEQAAPPAVQPPGPAAEGDGKAEPPEERDKSRAGYRALLSAAAIDDIEQMAVILDTEGEVPQWWLVDAFCRGVATGRGVAPRWLLAHGLDAAARDEDGRSLLSWTARRTPAPLDMVEELLQRGARGEDDAELLHRLCGQTGDEAATLAPEPQREERLPAMLSVLVEAGADPDRPDGTGRTALHWAAAHRGRETVERLLELGAAVDPEDHWGNTPLMVAVAGDRTAIARVLLRAGADPKHANDKGNSPLSVAMSGDDQTLAKITMSAARDTRSGEPDRGGVDDLHQAAAVGNLGRVKRLIGSGRDVQARDARGCTPLLRAAGAGHFNVVNALLAAGARPDLAADNGTTPLGAAVLTDHVDVIKLLCDRGVDPDQRQQQGITPLMFAAARWLPRAAGVLLRAGADPRARDETDGTPLMAAVQNALHAEDLEAGLATVRLLIDAGAELNAVNDEGQSALLLLCGVRAPTGAAVNEANVIRLAELIIDSGGDVDCQDLAGWSALHAAATHGLRQLAEFLIRRGASRRLRDINGLSPVDLAMDQSHDGLVDLFIRSG